MGTHMNNIGNSVVQIGILSRKLQSVSARSGTDKEVYEIATNIMLECQHLKEMTQKKSSRMTLKDYIERLF